jgi:transposase
MEYKRIAIDTSKHVFTIHGVDVEERVVLRREVRRSQLVGVFAKMAPTEVAMEACGGSHHWARVLGRLGHRVRLIPAQYVKPFVKRAKNDRNDAEAICEAAARPTMRSVPVKSAAQQADTMILRHRDMLVSQRTQTINALRGHAAEFGLIAPKGANNVTALLAAIAQDETIPATARAMFATMGTHIADLDAKLDEVATQLAALHKAHPVSRLLAGIPGVGTLIAVSMALSITPAHFTSGRHFAAWLGLTPRERSTGGKQRFGKISKAGNEKLRQLLITGAMAVIRFAKPGSKSASPWLLQLLERKPRKLAAVALANKTARIIWSMMTSGEAYRQPPVAA